MNQLPSDRTINFPIVRVRELHTHITSVRLLLACLILFIACLLPSQSFAQSGLLGNAWELDRSASSLHFQSVKNGSKVETSSFANFDGSLDENGLATILVELNSIDTAVDLRNVRMRFLFFETFKFPLAIITAQVDSKSLDTLASNRRMILPVQFEIDLHGIKKTLTVDTVMTLFTDDQISVTSASPVTIAAGDFNLMEGIIKLQEAANVQIVPSGSVSFDLTFKRNESAEAAPEMATRPTTQAAAGTSAQNTTDTTASALEASGDFSKAECATRFETLSQTGAINFAFGSSDIDPTSYPLLETLLNIIQRCPSLQLVVGGHTDSSGSDATNMFISSARAESVARYLLESGVSATRIRSIGFGEAQPLVPNDTRRNRARNRRIEFTIDER